MFEKEKQLQTISAYM